MIQTMVIMAVMVMIAMVVNVDGEIDGDDGVDDQFCLRYFFPFFKIKTFLNIELTDK